MLPPFANNADYLSRRRLLYSLGASLGPVALTGLFADRLMAAEPQKQAPLVPKKGHVPAKAKACILLYMEGGPSHIDTFDPKPALEKLHMQRFKRTDKFASAMSSGDRYYVKSPFAFRKVGQSGIDMCEHFQELAKVADELCIYKGCQAESINHPTANYHMNTGSQFGGEPSIGSWVTYGLGSENQDLPGFIVLPEVSYPQGGSANWGNGYLPPYFQGTPLRGSGSPILDITPALGINREHQRHNLDLLADLNNGHAEKHPGHDDLSARLNSYELAYRMQTEVPDVMDLSGENKETRALYGLDDPVTADFGRRCLLARKLVQKGVRFVQLFSTGWDSHDYIGRAHSERIRAVDRPIAALIADLKRLGMLDETLVMWTGEFGRSPDNGKRGGGDALGRDHNAKGMSMFFAGGGVRRGTVVGGTDEIGDHAVETVRPIRDVHCTILRLLGLDDNRLTFFHGGRFKQLSQIGGSVIGELIA